MAKNVWVVFAAAGLLAVSACGRAPRMRSGWSIAGRGSHR